MNALLLIPDVTFANGRVLFALLLVPVLGILSWLLTAGRTRIRWSVLGLRLLVVTAAIGALAEPLMASTNPASTTILVLDQSTSVGSATDTTVPQWLSAALSSAGSGDDAAIIRFGSSSDLAVPAQDAATINPDWADASDAELDPSFTNIESAIALARTLPVGGNRRIVLVSDGGENLGSVQNQVAQAARDGLPIDVVIVPGAASDDLRVDSLTAPVAIWQGEQPNVLVTVSTVTAGAGRLELVIDDALVDSQDVSLPAGLSTYSFTLPVLDPGFHDVRILVSGDATMDILTANNAAPAALIVRDAPEVMVVSATGSDPTRLIDALSTQGANVTSVTPDRLPVQLSLLGAYDAFVLNNVPASAFQVEQLAGLQEATRSLGKGLVVIGGTSSFGPGQYAGTRLEELLPVTIKVTDGRQRQRVALLMIVDQSGSMAYDPLQETSKIDMAKEAMRLAGTALAVGDTIGILSFSDSQEWAFPLTQIEDDGTRTELNNAIGSIKATGGTEIYPALQVGLDAIRNVEADVRHVVLITDGKSRSGTLDSYLKLVSEAGTDRTTVSTIAIGNDADTQLLKAIADAGAGRYHFTNKAEEIPQLALEEAQSAGAQSVIRGGFQPVQSLPSPIMSNFDPAMLPPLDGYDFASAKATAQVVLVSHRNDPVLAKWQHGLGRVVAWTADDGADLASQWSTWERFDEFWVGVLRWSLPDPENRTVSIDIARDGPDVVLDLSTGQDQSSGDYVDLSGLRARITGSDDTVTDGIPLTESGPGQYQIRIRDAAMGAFQLEFTGSDGEVRGDKLGFVLPGSPELLPTTSGPVLMNAIAETTGGRVLDLDDPAVVFDAGNVNAVAVRDYRPIWSWFAAAALLLFLLELFVRLNGFARLKSFQTPRRS